ncbi:hypothetical protein [Sinorhizobium fredii]|uniref:Uncharacterized protein n=1 Tax=Rhizobium fredii TaxID=380 RepID=A0A2A6M3S7_RHIFR|nr:hypothetical protein [Sinorhizobium fredii]PDT49210.1 hypothetical protein CO661_04865 [Sinorhizobium fredii]
MLDAMVFAIRRLVCELDGRMFPGEAPQFPTVSHREVLTRQPDYYCPMAMPLDVLIRSRDETPLRRAALNLNLAFGPRDYPHYLVWERSASRNPVIIRRILDPLASDDALCAAEGVEIARWFLANVKVPEGKQNDPGVVEQIREAMEAARAARVSLAWQV